MTTVEGDVFASYQQIELHPGDDGTAPVGLDVGLATTMGEAPYVTLLVPVHTATVRVTGVLTSSPPPPEDWECAVELSVLADPTIVVTGWAGGGVLELPDVEPGWYRVRYVVPDGQTWQDADERGEEYPGTCVLQLWPAPPAPPEILASRVPWSHYWTYGPEARHAAAAARAAHPTDPAEQLTLVIDLALSRHPEIADRIAAGDLRYQLGVIRYVQALRSGPGAYDPDAVADLITERARLGRPGG